MDALKATRFARPLEGLGSSIRKGSCGRPDVVSRRIGKILARFPSVAKYYTVTPVVEENPPPQEPEPKKPGKGRKRGRRRGPRPPDRRSRLDTELEKGGEEPSHRHLRHRDQPRRQDQAGHLVPLHDPNRGGRTTAA